MLTIINPVMDQLYNNRAAVPDHLSIFERWGAQSLLTRQTRSCELNIPYGRNSKQTLDIFSANENRGLVVFIHGGYWRSLDKNDFSFVAEPFLSAGISVALVNYRLCPDVTIGDIFNDCCLAINWLARYASGYGIGVDRTVLIGHSAGAHLVAMLYTNENLPITLLGGVGLSGLYDLAPLLETSINTDLHLDATAAKQLSPINLKPCTTATLELVVGGDETSEFIRQSALLPNYWPTHIYAEAPVAGYNHFTIVDHFVMPGSAQLKRTLALFS